MKIIKAEMCPDHMHMLARIPSNISVSSFMGYLKGKSAHMIFERHVNLKYKYGPPLLVWGILCRYSREECEENTRVHSVPNKRRLGI